jgi:hypothetical protein
MRMVCRISSCVAGSKGSQYPFSHCLKKTALLELESRSWLCSGGKKYLENRTNYTKLDGESIYLSAKFERICGEN